VKTSWTAQESETLVQYWATEGLAIAPRLPNRSSVTIQNRANRLKLRRDLAPDRQSGIVPGDRFERLVVLESRTANTAEREKGYNDRMWRCLCDCGNYCWVTAHRLNRRHSKSCGCLNYAPTATVESVITAVFNDYKTNAKIRGISFELTREDVGRLILSPCHYCNELPSRLLSGYGDTTPRVGGIDRKNNELWYRTENALPCCKACNKAKGSMSYDAYMAYRRRMACAELLARRHLAPDIIDAALAVIRTTL
jgi:hypothetical protein